MVSEKMGLPFYRRGRRGRGSRGRRGRRPVHKYEYLGELMTSELHITLIYWKNGFFQ